MILVGSCSWPYGCTVPCPNHQVDGTSPDGTLCFSASSCVLQLARCWCIQTSRLLNAKEEWKIRLALLPTVSLLKSLGSLPTFFVMWTVFSVKQKNLFIWKPYCFVWRELIPLLTYLIFCCFAPLIFLAREKRRSLRFGLMELVKTVLRTD